jgi:tRNA A-37 threonylcarbamoyl transferase component Bud32
VSNVGPAAKRFLEQRLLGRGAMGAVYLVQDRETGEQLALKKLQGMDAKSVLRLKREFRTLADVRHPNLVKLYELGHEDEVWFLTMEYVPGVDLTTHLGLGPARSSLTDEDSAFRTVRPRSADALARVTPTFHQLAAGVNALHHARVLHRDLKPSNVLVAGQRVVVLDFGLARRLDERAATVTEDGNVAGTPAYMAPEQVHGEALSEASDWYAFGTMLYETLTGLRPFDGSMYEILQRKLDTDPVPPIELDAGISPSLNALCMALLARDPSARPNGAEVLARLESGGRHQPRPSLEPFTTLVTDHQTTAAAASESALYGREQQLGTLHAAQQRAAAGRTTLVHVRGVSGAGKSALVEEFLKQLERDVSGPSGTRTLVLRSRCYEREAMPFKALDGVMDSLSRHFLSLDDIEVSHLMPSDVAALAKLFPVLERVRAVQQLLVSRSIDDAVNSRQRAELALRDLFARLSARSTLVIWIDDLQWGDLDSAAVLKSWLQRTSDRPILVLFSYRADELETSECLRAIFGDAAPLEAEVEVVDVPPLAAKDVSAICRERLRELSADDPLIQRIVQEAQGSPFLAAQLASLARAKRARGSRDLECSISGLISETTALLTPEARTLLAVLAVAGRPIQPKLALRAAQLRHGGRDIVHELRRLQLVRTREAAGERLLEVYHDRVREAVQQALDPQQSQEVYTALLAAVSFSGRADPDWLHTLAVGAGENAAALRYGLIAAERATTTLAFERAAELYQRCLELLEPASSRRVELLRKRAAVLAWCGHGASAADVYLEAAQLASGPEALQMMRFATSHLLRSGRFAEGEAMLQRVLGALDEHIPSTTGGLIRAITWEKVRLAARGMRFTPRRQDEVPAALLARFDTFDALRLDSMAVDPMRAYLFLVRLTRWALEAGEPLRVLRAFGAMCYVEASSGTPRAAKRVDHLLVRMAELVKQIDTPQARVEDCVIRALSSWMLGRPEDVLAPSLEAEQLLSKLGPSDTGADYLLRRATSSARIGALFELSEYGAFASELQSELQTVRAIGNRAAVLQLALNETLLDELLDRGRQGLERLEQQRLELPPVEFSVYHALHMIAVCRAGCLSGELSWAIERLEQEWPRFQRSPLRSGANIAIHARHTRLHLLVTQHILTARSVANVPRALEAEIRALAASDPRAKPSSLHESARIALATGDKPRALALMHESLACAGARHPDRVRYGLGLMIGGDEGATICAESQRALQERGLANVTGCMRADFPEHFREWR